MINAVRILTLVTLILILSFFYLEPASGEITIDGNTIHVETASYEVQFDRGVITQLHNKLTEETYTLPPDINRGIQGYTGIIRRDRPIWTWDAITIEPSKINPHQAEILFRDGQNEIRVVIAVDPRTDDLLISGDCVSENPGAIGMQWGIGNLDFYNLNLILPAETGQIIDATTAIKHKTFNYPQSEWEAQLAIIQAERGGFYVRGTDETFQFKGLNYRRAAESFGLGFITRNQAPWDGLTAAKSVIWRLNAYVGDWCVPAQIYRDWMEATFDPWRLSDVPAWVQDIGLVADDVRLDIKTLERLAEQVNPTQTLLYLISWRKHGGHDVNYPDYIPKDELGGFVEAAHRLGYRVMLHVNLHSFSAYHPRYPEFQSFQIRYPNGELSGWKWDELDSPERLAHITLAHSNWRNLLVQSWKAIWEEYNIDAFHLDTSHYVVNDGNGLIEGLTSAQANVLMHMELAEAMPGVVFGGENLHEVTFFRESFAQRVPWSAEIKPHPISAFLFSPYTHSYGSIGFPPPNSLEYHTHLDAYEGRGILPTLSIWRERVLDGHHMQQMLSVVRQWQDLGLQPDVGCDWGPDTLFRYRTRTGATVIHQRKPSGSVLTLPNDGGYERVFNVTQAQTDRSLPLWRGYNETHLIGLDPSRYYLLDNAPRDFSQVRVNALSPDVYISETRVTDQVALFRLESTGSARQTSVGFFLPTPPVGSVPDTLRHTDSGQYTVEADLSQPVVIFLTPFQQISLPHNLRAAQFATGLQFDGVFRLGSYHSSGDLTTITVDNVSKETISAHPPVDGQTILQFPLLLPEAPSTFSFSVGLAHPDGKGFLCQVRVNGQTYFEAFKDTVDWMNGDISLSAFAGQPMVLELVTAPVQAGGAGADWDWAHWADLHITATPNPDANLDGRVNILDLITVAHSLGQQPPSNPQADTNKDGVVNLLDLVFVAEHLSQNAAAPAQLRFIESIPSSAKEVIAAHRALTELEAIPNKTPRIQIAIELLRHYLAIADRNVKETKLLPNYPNPFNPDTWIPYQLSEGSTVTVKIYDVGGRLVRTIEVGHKPVGYYLTRERAVYWDGRTGNREPVSSGVYFYTLNTDTYTQTRRMVIVK